MGFVASTCAGGVDLVLSVSVAASPGTCGASVPSPVSELPKFTSMPSPKLGVGICGSSQFKKKKIKKRKKRRIIKKTKMPLQQKI